MNSAIQAMIDRYHPQNDTEKENAIKKVIQEIALAGLSRSGFFKKVAFYGGTCLRIFHGLNRFSEDLDFALLSNDSSFKLEDYFGTLEKEFLSYGIEVHVDSKMSHQSTAIQSAFLKGNTLMLLLTLFPSSVDARNAIPNQKMKVKFEIDTENPEGGTTEYRYRLLPAPYEIQIFDEASLFAGKIHALLCRNYQHHVKGRDFYDYLFYISKGTRINLTYLGNKLMNSNHIARGSILTIEIVKTMLRDKFLSVDYASAKVDVYHFISDHKNLDLWSAELFISTLDTLHSM